MRKSVYLIFAFTVILSLCAISCKTTEKNYREAYDRAIAAADTNRRSFNETVYGSVRQQMRHSAMVVQGDTMEIRSQRVRVTEGGGGINESIKPFMIVVGEFKQMFNARSMRERLLGLGYPGAFVVETGEPYYFVVAKACDNAEQALEALNAVRKKPPFRLRDGLPFVLSPAGRR